MVIQRIQTLYLLIAAIIMGLYCTLVPIGTVGETAVHVPDVVPVLVVTLVTIAVTVIDIFLFKNLKTQIAVCGVAQLLIVATLGTFSVIYFKWLDSFTYSELLISVAAPVASYIFLMLARAGMKRDYKTLRDYDHFR